MSTHVCIILNLFYVLDKILNNYKGIGTGQACKAVAKPFSITILQINGIGQHC